MDPYHAPAGASVIAILLAGGQGTRFNPERPKQLTHLGGRPVLSWAAAALDESGVVDGIVVAARQDAFDAIAAACAEAIRRTPHVVVAGGSSRNGSVANAVAAIDLADARVLVHDAARPLASPGLVRAVAGALKAARSVMPVLPSADRLVEVSGDTVTRFADQRAVVRGQSPGGYRLTDLRKAFAHHANCGYPPHITVFELVLAWDPTYRITTIPGEPANIKITYPVDHALAECLLGPAGHGGAGDAGGAGNTGDAGAVVPG